MNTNLRRAKNELGRLRRFDAVYGTEIVEIVLDFSRPGKQPKYFSLTAVRCPKHIAQAMLNRKKNEADY